MLIFLNNWRSTTHNWTAVTGTIQKEPSSRPATRIVHSPKNHPIPNTHLFYILQLISYPSRCTRSYMRSFSIPVITIFCLCTMAQGGTIKLKNGTILKGEIIADTGESVTVRADLIGEITIVRADIDNTATEPATPAPESDVKRVTAPNPVEVAKGKVKTDPKKPFWKRSISISGNYSSASFDQGSFGNSALTSAGLPDSGASLGLQGVTSCYNLSALLIRATATQIFEFSGSFGQAKYEPATSKVVDNYGGTGSFTQILNPTRYVLASSSYKVDKVALIDHQFEQIVGYGFKIIDTEQTKFDLIPGVSISESKQGTIYDGDWIISAGFLERFEYNFNERVAITQRLLYTIGVEETDVWKAVAQLKLKAGLTKSLSLILTGNYTYDNSLGPIPVTTLSGLGPLASLYKYFQPAKKGRFTLESGIELDF